MLAVNLYVIYNTKCGLKSVKSMSHYEFWRQPVLSKLDPHLFGGWDNLSSAELR